MDYTRDPGIWERHVTSPAWLAHCWCRKIWSGSGVASAWVWIQGGGDVGGKTRRGDSAREPLLYPQTVYIPRRQGERTTLRCPTVQEWGWICYTWRKENARKTQVNIYQLAGSIDVRLWPGMRCARRRRICLWTISGASWGQTYILILSNLTRSQETMERRVASKGTVVMRHAHMPVVERKVEQKE